MTERMKKYVTDVEHQLFIPFITAGHPTPETTVDIALLLQQCGADAIELGIPYSDPLADGPVIQQASQTALAQGMTLQKAITLVSDMRDKGLQIPVIIFTYYNMFLRLGETTFFNMAQEHDIDGLLIPDLPHEESESVRALCKTYDVNLISLVAPTTAQERLEVITQHAEGFLYCVSSLGVTGTRSEFHPDVEAFLNRVNALSSVPVAVGFGVSKPVHLEQLSNFSDGVVVGSAIVSKIDESSELLTNVETKQQGLDNIKAFVDHLLEGRRSFAK